VARFAPFEANISSAIRGGELEPAFQVFAVYKQRVGERVAYAPNAARRAIGALAAHLGC